MAENFFRRMQRRLNPTDITDDIPEPLEYPWLQKQYIHFCQSRLLGKNNPDELLHDLDLLIRIPEITHITFRETNQGLDMLLGTKRIYLTSKETSCVHDIGEFIVTINRRSKQLRFANITGALVRPINGLPQVTYHHPHIPNTGEMCITSGKNLLFECIAEGRMFAAVQIIVGALTTIDDFPYPDAVLENWPLKEYKS